MQIEKVKEVLENNLDKINNFLSIYVGTNTHLTIKEKTNYKNDIYYSLVDDGLEDYCGVMSKCFESVTMTGTVYHNKENENQITVDIGYSFSYKNGGSNGCHLVHLQIENDDIQDNIQMW